MEELESILHNINITKFDVQTVHWVHITHIISPHDFYVRPTRYKAFIQRLESLQLQVKPSSLNEYDVVIFDMDRSGNDVKYARGRICRAHIAGNIQNYDIFAFDYGYLHRTVPIEYIWECNDDFLNIPPLALYCQLANCMALEGKNWMKESIDAFKLYIGNERAKMIILDKTFDKFIVELINTNPDDIATLMALTGYSTMGYVHNAISRMPTATPKKMFFTFKNIAVNDILHVRLQSGKTQEAFYVADVNDYQHFLKECDNITYYAKKEPKLSEDQFKINTAVYIKNDLNKYERAIIKEIIVPDTKAIVKLVDWGKEEQAHILNMRSMSEQCLRIPVIAIYCSTNDEQFRDNGIHKFLYPGFEFLIQIKHLGNEFDSPNIVNILPLQDSSAKYSRQKRLH